MSIAKQLMEQDDSDRHIAHKILERVGKAKKCEPHEIWYDAHGADVEDAYRLANSLITKEDPLVSGLDGDRRRATDAIKRACAELPEECGYCAKNRSED